MLVAIVVNPRESNAFYVIDGQQRLSTLTMLLCVARDVILEDLRKEEPKPDGFEKILELIQNTHMGKHTSWKLQLNDTDKEFFQMIQKYENEELTQFERIKKEKLGTSSLKLLRKNYMNLHEKITDALYADFGQREKPDIDSLDDEEKRKLRLESHPTLLYFLTHLRENNYLIQIMVADDNAAFQIFETLNERGQTLSKSNLIKNHILNKIKNEDTQRDQSNRWNEIFDKIIEDRQPDDDFIIESYHSRLADTRSLRTKMEANSSNIPEMSKKNLYKVVKKMVTDEATCSKFIEELKKDAYFLADMNDPSNYDNNNSDDMRAIRALKAKFIRVPILAAHRKWVGNDRDSDYVNLVKLLVKFFFKTRVVREVHPGQIEKIMREVTKRINQGEPFSEIHQWVKAQDSHDDFMTDFQKRFMPKPANDAAKYVLQQITIHLGNKYSDVRPIDNLTLEHILPKSYEEWNSVDFFKDYHDEDVDMSEFVDRLGNLTLLTKTINEKIRNMQFIVKKTQKDPKTGEQIGYESSELHINKKTVCNHEEWTAKVIIDREKEFVKYADQIWRLD